MCGATTLLYLFISIFSAEGGLFCPFHFTVLDNEACDFCKDRGIDESLLVARNIVESKLTPSAPSVGEHAGFIIVQYYGRSSCLSLLVVLLDILSAIFLD